MPFDVDNFEQVGQQIEARASQLPKAWAARVVVHAKSRAAVRTGLMRDSIVDVSEGDEGIVEAQADYSGYVEYGTVHMEAQPYFNPGVEQATAELPELIEEVMS